MGTVVISVDAELGWGFQNMPVPPTDQTENGRWGWEQLVDMFESYNIPATWAVVGHLFLDECNGHHEAHPAGDEWFVREREKLADSPELRCAPDLIERLRSSRVDHDIGLHSFSNIDFGTQETTRALAQAEVNRCRSLAEEHGFAPTSFVFPYNSIGHRGLLASHGFRCYRGGRSPDGGRLRKLAEATVLPGRPRLVEPAIDEYGLVNVPPSLFLFGYEGLARTLTTAIVDDPIVVAARNGIDATSERDGVFHMWFHQNDITTERDRQRVEMILEYLDEKREELNIGTMADVAAGLQQTQRIAAKR